jgi:hypothetical protein
MRNGSRSIERAGNYPLERASERGRLFWLLLEDTQLTKAAHPILCVPGANNFPIFKFVDIDNLNVHLSVLRRKTHEWLFLSAGHSRTDDHLTPVLEDVLDR